MLLYGYTDVSVNNLTYKMYCSLGRVIFGKKFPPCFDSLKQHINRASYQAAMWRRSLECNQTIPDVENGIDIAWNECSSTPNEILYLFSCGCSWRCKVGTCLCLDGGLQCTDSCHTHKCKNMPEDFLNRGLDALDEGEDD